MSEVNPRAAIRQLINDAKATMQAADNSAGELAELLVGRLRLIRGWGNADTLANLKRELRDYNIHTNKWKP